MNPKPSEKIVQSSITDYLEMRGYKVIRLNSGARRIEDAKYGTRFIKLAPAGTPDLLVLPQFQEVRKMHNTTHPSHAFFIECKAPGGRLSPQQMSSHNDYALRGVQVITASSIDDVVKWLEGQDAH